MLGPDNRCERVDLPDAGLHIVWLAVVGEVDLVEHNPISERQLLDSFVLNPAGFLFIQVWKQVFGVDHRDNRVETQLGCHLIVDEERRILPSLRQ